MASHFRSERPCAPQDLNSCDRGAEIGFLFVCTFIKSVCLFCCLYTHVIRMNLEVSSRSVQCSPGWTHFLVSIQDPVLASFFLDRKYMHYVLKTHPRFFTPAIFFEFLRKENPLVSFCTMHFTGGFKNPLRIRCYFSTSKVGKRHRVAVDSYEFIQYPW